MIGIIINGDAHELIENCELSLIHVQDLMETVKYNVIFKPFRSFNRKWNTKYPNKNWANTDKSKIVYNYSV